MLEPLFLNFERRDVLSEDERALLRSALTRERRFATREDIVSEGDRPTHSTVLLDGFAARYNITADGNRQFTAIHVPGEFIDLHAFLVHTMDHGIVALSPCRVATAEHQALKQITETAPHLTRLLWLDTLIQGAIYRQWIVAMGRRSRAAHLAHIICELHQRLQVVGRVEGLSFHLPLSQTEMADVLGLSLVHMNRVIQELRREELIVWTRETITILDWSRLQRFAGFDPIYLSLQNEPR
ncbi:Crp/Fnr family transcriptional regulator [Rhizobium oryzicola]|uniref:Crp/Fnr family transcriptional regulator n=1 Tax=Rhizobium oryzicola TaxID=1232668 RepID=A0ABT8T2K3_9HYPH|nr:Crp/Fnr family transcriptional regulator [Rhizobium oryzicola]MDO1584406.1 Crp/Fnr family transcriptional regulator [Rhizobium oryzicola]